MCDISHAVMHSAGCGLMVSCHVEAQGLHLKQPLNNSSKHQLSRHQHFILCTCTRCSQHDSVCAHTCCLSTHAMQLCGSEADFLPSVLAAAVQQHAVDLQHGWPLQGDVAAAECFMQLLFHLQFPEQQEAPTWRDLLRVYPQAAAAAGNTCEEVQQAQAVSVTFLIAGLSICWWDLSTSERADHKAGIAAERGTAYLSVPESNSSGQSHSWRTAHLSNPVVC